MRNGKIAVCLAICFIGKSAVFAQSTNNQHKGINVPARVAFLPGFSSQGRKDNYTTSNFSLNVLGGATGSVNGFEVGGWFNIDRKNIQGLQVAGWFNVTRGSVNGMQVAGWFNTVKNNVTGFQVGGITNYAGNYIRGFQVAGLYNHVSGSFTGMQVAGICNYTHQAVNGMQVAGIANINNSSVSGFQLAGIVNYTKHLKGLQLGLINIADTSDGYSIGLINVVRNGYYKIAISTNEVLNTNLAIKSGNAKLYNILMVGINAGSDEKSFSYGYGIGHEIKAGRLFTINPEITTQYLYLGNWHYFNSLSKVQVLATVKLTPGIALFAGPSFAVYYSDQPEPVKGYKYLVPNNNYHTLKLWNNNVRGWFGWTAGISFM